MNPLQILERENEILEREILELETIIEDDEINYSNLIHVFKKFHNLWNNHEEKEEKIFDVLNKEGYTMQIKKLTFEDFELKKEKEELIKALKSGSEFKVKESLKANLPNIIREIKKQIDQESWAFCMVDWSNIRKESLEIIQLIQILPLESGTDELVREIEANIIRFQR